VQLLPGVGAKAAEKLWKAYLESKIPRSEAGSQRSEARVQNSEDGARKSEARGRNPPSAVRPLATALQSCAAVVPKKAAAAWAQITATLAQLEAEDVRQDAGAMIRLALEASYGDYLKELYANYESRQEDLEQLAVFARQFESVEDFLTQLALLTNLEAEDQGAGENDDERIRLSTIHQAKGLEFDVVFVIMLCDGLFPSERSLETDKGEEEERRLMYVAVTRARNELYLSYPLMRAGYGGRGDMMQQPSRFLEEIPKELVEEWNLRPFNPYG